MATSLNYIAQLGWSLEDGKEIQTLAEMEKNFDVSRVQKGGARFDFEKAKWVNKEHMSRLSSKELIAGQEALFESMKSVLGNRLEHCVELVKERFELLSDIEIEMNVFMNDPNAYDEKSMKRISKFDVNEIGGHLKVLLNSGTENLKERITERAKELEIGMGAFMQVLRVAVVGGLNGPDLMPLVELIGKDVTLRRIERLISN